MRRLFLYFDVLAVFAPGYRDRIARFVIALRVDRLDLRRQRVQRHLRSSGAPRRRPDPQSPELISPLI